MGLDSYSELPGTVAIMELNRAALKVALLEITLNGWTEKTLLTPYTEEDHYFAFGICENTGERSRTDFMVHFWEVKTDGKRKFYPSYFNVHIDHLGRFLVRRNIQEPPYLMTDKKSAQLHRRDEEYKRQWWAVEGVNLRASELNLWKETGVHVVHDLIMSFILESQRIIQEIFQSQTHWTMLAYPSAHVEEEWPALPAPAPKVVLPEIWTTGTPKGFPPAPTEPWAVNGVCPLDDPSGTLSWADVAKTITKKALETDEEADDEADEPQAPAKLSWADQCEAEDLGAIV